MASRLGDKITEDFKHKKINVELIEDRGGIFEVRFYDPLYTLLMSGSEDDIPYLPYSSESPVDLSRELPQLKGKLDTLLAELKSEKQASGGAIVLIYQKEIFTLASGEFPQYDEIEKKIGDLPQY
jgi:hypothetical protein